MLATRIACVFSLGLLSAAALAQTDPPSAPVEQAAAQALEEAPSQVLVSGKRPGPGLWKVSKDGHVMWVFGMYSPLPLGMEWDDSRVDRLIGQSQEVLAPPSTGVGIGWLGGLKLVAALPSAIGVVKNPDGAELHDVLPADVYARWSVLKQKYIGDDDGIERYRPFFAAQKLQDAGMQKSGLSGGIEVRKQIESLAKKRDVKLTQTGFSVNLDDPGRLLKDFKQSQLEDTSCFTKTLARFEGDIDAMRMRANAWAKGNIAEISNLDYAEREDACNDAILNSPAAQKHPAFQNLRERRLASWLKAAERSLANNTSTVALLPMSDILGPKSYLTVLQAKGYTVESPK
ncbi:TraB/GumN family protein [Massilia aerilata]|uniref:TraB/GumN family protein n=1 Tax=Massilia aerilata TaxID=453817 RepID=A0ABW0S380_9BURK